MPRSGFARNRLVLPLRKCFSSLAAGIADGWVGWDGVAPPCPLRQCLSTEAWVSHQALRRHLNSCIIKFCTLDLSWQVSCGRPVVNPLNWEICSPASKVWNYSEMYDTTSWQEKETESCWQGRSDRCDATGETCSAYMIMCIPCPEQHFAPPFSPSFQMGMRWYMMIYAWFTCPGVAKDVWFLLRASP